MLILNKFKLNSSPKDGWYVFQRFALKGPFKIERAIKLASAFPTERNLLIRHLGFCKWYSLQDLSTICYGDRVPLNLNPQSIQLSVSSIIEQYLNVKTACSEQKPFKRISEESLRQLQDRLYLLEQRLNPVPRGRNRPVNPSDHLLLTNLEGMELQYSYENMLTRPPRKSWHMLLALLTCGLSLGWWLRQLLQKSQNIFIEESFHWWEGVLIMLPVLNLPTLLRLRAHLCAWEEKHGVNSMNTALLLLASFCPPLALYYLHHSLESVAAAQDLDWVV